MAIAGTPIIKSPQAAQTQLLRHLIRVNKFRLGTKMTEQYATATAAVSLAQTQQSVEGEAARSLFPGPN